MALLAASVHASAGQAPPSAGSTGVAETNTPEPQIVTRWNSGIDIASADGDSRLQIGALIQADGRFAVADERHDVVDTLLLGRVRPIVQGRIAGMFDFRFVPDFAGGTLVLFDAYLETRLSNAFRVRVGKDKTPIGLEQLQSDAFDPTTRGWGALQLAARDSTVRIDPRVSSLGLAAAGTNRSATAISVSANRYLNRNVKYVLAAERTRFNEGVHPAERAIVFRVQLNLQPVL